MASVVSRASHNPSDSKVHFQSWAADLKKSMNSKACRMDMKTKSKNNSILNLIIENMMDTNVSISQELFEQLSATLTDLDHKISQLI